MAIDEKYLDDLLKSITENEEEPRTMDDAMREMASSSEEENEDWANTADEFLSQDQGEKFDNNLDLDDYLEKALPEAESIQEEEVDSEEMELLKEITAAGLSYEQADLDPLQQDDEELDIAEMMDVTGIGDDDLEEINGLLNKVNEATAVDEDILALLESMENSDESEETEELFKMVQNEALEAARKKEEMPVEEPAPKEKKEKRKKNRKEKPQKPEKPEKKSKVWGRKKKGDKEQNPDQEQTDEEVKPVAEEEIVVDPEEVELEEIKPGTRGKQEVEEPENRTTKDTEPDNKKEKQPGFFSKLIKAFMQDDEEFDDPSEENKKLLKEIGDEENKGKKGKKKGGKGKADNAKASKKAGKKKPKKEKPKKQKAPKKPKEKKEDQVKEKPGKPLGKKTWFVLIAFSGTLLASIILLSVFLPEYADKKAAQKAFYAGDYETVYTLLYDKKISADDALIFNKAKTICTMERRIQSYENNLTLNRELEAVDALLKGVLCYQTLIEADEYGVRNEVDALYMQICSILENNYGISTEEALEINAYDSKAYTQKLHEVVYGIESEETADASEPEAAAEALEPEELLPEDFLPEEEALID